MKLDMDDKMTICMREQKTCEFKPAPKCKPLSYPGKRPEYSYMFKDDHISEIDTKKTVSDIDELKDRILPEKDECCRYLVAGYGSNANPPQLQIKFSCLDDAVHPVLRGCIEGYDAVYSNRITSKRYVPATITESPGTVMEVWANLLNAEQLEVMDKTEGWPNTYSFVKLDAEFVLENGVSFPTVYAYVDNYGELREDSDNPIRVKQVDRRNHKFTEMIQERIMQEFRKRLDLHGSDDKFASDIKDKQKRDCYNKKLCPDKIQTISIKDVRCDAETISWFEVCIPAGKDYKKCPDWNYIEN